MLIYNISFHIDDEAFIRPFLSHMREHFLPAVTAQGYLRQPRFMRLLTDIGDGLVGYSLMCECDSAADLKCWKREVGDALLAALSHHFGDKVLTFSSTLRVVQP